jgi:hypothetical protein
LDYVGRIRGLTYFDNGQGFYPISDLFSQATKSARYLGFWVIAKTNPMPHHAFFIK